MTDTKKNRWRIALHEAGHAVAFLKAWPRCGKMEVIARSSGGFTTAPEGIRPAPFAIGVAAAQYAEKLARRYPVPGDPPPPPTAESGATAEAIRADAVAEAAVKTNPTRPDPELIAEVCISYAPGNPADWVERHAYFHAEAKKLVKKHASDIHSIAVELYQQGRWTYEGDKLTNLQFSGAVAGDKNRPKTGTNEEEHKMNVAEMMKQKSEAAAAEVKKLMWQGADAGDIADAALSGGLTPDVVGKIEGEVTASKQAIDSLRRFDLPAIKAAHDERSVAADKTAKALELAETAHEEAAAAARDAAGLMFEAKSEFEAIASRVTGGEMPAEGLPDTVLAIIEARRHYATFEQAASRAKSLEAEITQGEMRVEALTAESARIKKTDPHLVNERMAPLFEDYTASAKTLAKKIGTAKKEAATLKKEAASARAKYEAEKAKLPW